jgi:hypothetical protein
MYYEIEKKLNEKADKWELHNQNKLKKIKSYVYKMSNLRK